MLHELASYPWVYDWIQKLAGARHVYGHISRQLPARCNGYVLDVGGGTGDMRQLWPAECRYVCLDIERPKLEGFRSKVQGGLALQTDATRMPIASGCADSVLCTAVAHHLTDAMLENVSAETLRKIFSRHFHVAHWEQFAVYHEYVFGVGETQNQMPVGAVNRAPSFA